MWSSGSKVYMSLNFEPPDILTSQRTSLLLKLGGTELFFPSFVLFSAVKINCFLVSISISFLSPSSNGKRQLDQWDTQADEGLVSLPMAGCAEYSPQLAELLCGQNEALQVKYFCCQ